MKKLILEEMFLLSSAEGKARRIRFDPQITTILGANDTGKSSLIKSIYWTFGAEPPAVHTYWSNLKIVSVVRFSIEGKKYSILRHEKFFALFEGKSKMLATYTSVTSGLGPKLAEILDFKIKLTSKDGRDVVPPPAYYFLPFYIDQDSSWAHNWSSFQKLGQISNWRVPIIEYHTGIKGNEYYEIKSGIDRIKLAMEKLDSERGFFQGTLDQLKKEVESIDFSIDIESFSKEIENLISELDNLRANREEFKNKLIDAHNLKSNLESQINIVNHALIEAKEDYKFASVHDHIECPICGQDYENSFAERFSIAKDEHRCSELLSKLNMERIVIINNIDKVKNEYESKESEISKLQDILTKKQGQLNLNDVLKNEGKKQVKKFLIEKISSLGSIIGEKELERHDLEKQKKKLVKTWEDKKKRIMNLYTTKMGKYLHDLDVNKLPENSYKKITSVIDESGSDKPRALLAYYYSILSVMHGFASSVFSPIIIDSPNQQDQDKESLKKMLSFIEKERIEGTQLILGLTDTNGIKFGGTTIPLEDKYSLLQKKDYEEIFEIVNPLLSKSLLK